MRTARGDGETARGRAVRALDSALAVSELSRWSFIAGPALAALYTDSDGTRLLREGMVGAVWAEAGGALQVNLTQREEAAFDGDARRLYEELSAAHPAPFSAYLEGSDFAVASCSPERFLKLKGRRVEARPIKGTVGCCGTAQEERLLSVLRTGGSPGPSAPE